MSTHRVQLTNNITAGVGGGLVGCVISIEGGYEAHACLGWAFVIGDRLFARGYEAAIHGEDRLATVTVNGFNLRSIVLDVLEEVRLT